MLKRSINIEVIYFEQPWAERFKAAKADGFDFIEFWGWEDKDLPVVKKLLNETGLKLSAMSGDGPFSMCDPLYMDQYIAFIKRSIEAAKFLECPTLVIHSDALEDSPQYAKPLSGDYSITTKICTMFDVLKQIAPMAEQAGVTFVLEALNIVKDHCGYFLTETKTSSELVQAVHSPNVKILYDAYHMYLNEGKIFESTENYVGSIGYIHIADAPGRHEPGTGALNYRQFLKHLVDIGYDKVVGFELYPQNGSQPAIKAIKEVSDNL